MPNSLSVFLNVQDVDRALAFYKALGFKVKSATRGDDKKVLYADLDMDGAELGLGAISSNPDPEFQKWVGTPLGAGVMIYLTLPGKVDKVFAKAKKAGATIEMEPTDRPYGRVAMLNDLDGYVLSLHQDAPRKPAKKAKAAKRVAPAKRSKATKKAKRPIRR